ncbi:hypothetical protein RN001_005095 [Aquatica leii]|uniref:DNA polymerase zeta catalytic subunit n=1 Tax=Aquatica leii TaxID=1421715 RepID=A0AAN7SAE6_9COLE|nr:hypothetical protein RN001_005095 [Aquatica leii]
MFLIRIFTVDFYMSTPMEGLDLLYSEFRGSSTSAVPIIRIFGSSETGHKTCLHVHGVFPYLYIPYDGIEDSSSLMYQIANKLDQAINISLGHASSTTQHVYKIVLVSGIPFYGYHYREHQFFKIFFYNPLIMKKACSLLQNGNICGKIYQLHESHIPFVLQFMIDYNLHGMNFISLSQVFYRVNDSISQEDIPSQFLLPPTVLKKSTCRVEADALAENIVNRIEVAAGKIMRNPGIAALWEDEQQRRRNKNENSQISPCMSQNRIDIPPTDSDTLYKCALRDKLIAGRVNKHIITETSSSMYPVETPKTHNLISASFVQGHSLTNESSVLLGNTGNSVDISNSFLDSSYLDTTNLNDTQANDLLRVLQDLASDANDRVEEDSILSQTVKLPDESEDENEADMTMPFVTTPIKVDSETVEVNLGNNVGDVFSSHEQDDLQSSDGIRKESTVCVESSIANSQVLLIPEQVKRKLTFMEMRQCTRVGKGTKRLESNKDNETAINNAQFLQHNHLSKAEEYDLASNIVCSEGPSKEQNIFSGSDSSFIKCSPVSPFLHDNVLSKLEEYDCSSSLVCCQDSSKELFSDSDSSLVKLSSDSLSSLSKKSEPIRSSNSQSVSNDCKNIQSSLSFKSSVSVVRSQYVNQNKNNLILDDLRMSRNVVSSNERYMTPKINFSQNMSMLQATVVNNDEITLCNFEYYVVMPKFNPPAREDIINTLEEYNISLVTHQKPFYSDCEDVSGEVQIGHKRLRIGTLYSDLLEFETSLVEVSLQQLIFNKIQTMYPQEQVSNKFLSAKLSFCEDADCVVTPTALPPTRRDILVWIKAKTNRLNR